MMYWLYIGKTYFRISRDVKTSCRQNQRVIFISNAENAFMFMTDGGTKSVYPRNGRRVR